jgi:5-methylcytosine-specific restriction endonuclease McrA
MTELAKFAIRHCERNGVTGSYVECARHLGLAHASKHVAKMALASWYSHKTKLKFASGYKPRQSPVRVIFDASHHNKPITNIPDPVPPLPIGKRFEQTDAFLESREWRQIRYRALRLHGAKCLCCGHTAQTSGKPLHVDHIKPRALFPELALDLNNLQVLCADCNLGKGAWDQTDWRHSA